MSDKAGVPSHESGNEKPASFAIKEKGKDRLPKKYRRWLQFDIVLLTTLMVITWGLLTLPIVFYYHPLPVVSIPNKELYYYSTIVQLHGEPYYFCSICIQEGVSRDGNGSMGKLNGNDSTGIILYRNL